jgi:hypothetical protein
MAHLCRNMKRIETNLLFDNIFQLCLKGVLEFFVSEILLSYNDEFKKCYE